MTSERAQRGFTVIEMLAATMLLAIVLSVLLPEFGLFTKHLKQSEIRSRMAVVARSLIDEAVMAGLRSGQTEGVRDDLQWQLECQSQDTENGITLFVLNLTLRGGGQTEEFSTARFQFMDPGLEP